jgi:spore coat polysaccharide biosynthesis predicted glycosyltransferase SpsG
MACPSDVEIAVLPENDTDEVEVIRKWITNHNPSVVLIDSYDANTNYQAKLRETAEKTAVILDDTRYTICGDYLINGNVYAPELDYKWRGSEPTWCLGLDYLPVHEEIRNAAVNPEPFHIAPRRAIVTMGGSDINGTTPTVCRAFDGTDITVDIVIGPGFDNSEEIQQAMTETDADFERFDDPDDFATLIARADLAVSAAGSTIYELLAVGTPTIAIPQAANQEPIARTLADRDTIEWLELSNIDELPDRITELVSNVDRRRNLRRRGRNLIDCRGAQRIYRTLEDLSV